MLRKHATDETGTPTSNRHSFLLSSVRRHPMTSFLVWFFTIGQALVFAPVVLRVNGVSLSTEPFIIGSTWLGLLLPAVTIRWLTDGREGLRRLWADAFRVRVRTRWYLVALLAVPLGILGLQWAAEGTPRVTPQQWAEALAVGFVVNTIVVFATVNWAEEVVWTGFVQGALQQRGWSPLRSAVAAGPLFALGHVSLVVGGGDFATGMSLLLLIVALSIPFRALQGWLYNRTRSLVLPGLVHAAGNAAALGSLASQGLVPLLFGTDGQSVLIFAALGVVVLAMTRARLGRPASS